MRIEIPEHPYYETDALRRDEALLDELVQGYRIDSKSKHDPATFLFGFAPARLFERAFTRPPQKLPIEGYAWVLFLSGYFGGLWLRTRMREAQLDSMLTQLGSPPTPEAFQIVVTRARGGTSAARGSDADALAYAEGILPELVAGFGYNQGYLQEILDRPPKGARAPRGFLIPGGALWCGYRNPHLEILAGLHDVSQKLRYSHDAEWNRLGHWIPAAQAEETERGQIVWSSGFSVRGFSQRSYEQLLDLSASFLEVMQATALTAVRAIAESDANSARHAAAAHACLGPWGSAYSLGLMDNRFDTTGPRLPSFRD